MKKILFIAISAIVTLCAHAQKAQEPEFEFEPYVLNLADSTLQTMLPVENAYGKAKASASLYLVGVGKVKTYWYVDGNQSSLQLDTNAKIVINTGGKSPMQTISINRMEQLGKKRRYLYGEAGSFTGATTGQDNSASFRYKKYGKESVMIPFSDLAPGEYVLSITNTMTNNKIRSYSASNRCPKEQKPLTT